MHCLHVYAEVVGIAVFFHADFALVLLLAVRLYVTSQFGDGVEAIFTDGTLELTIVGIMDELMQFEIVIVAKIERFLVRNINWLELVLT